MSFLTTWNTFVFALLVTNSLTAATPSTANRFEFDNPAEGSVTSPAFQMLKDQSLKVRVLDGGKDFSPDVFIYNALTKDLMAMTDQESTEPYFLWSAPISGSFYAVLRNASSSSGKCLMEILPEGSRGLVRGQLASSAKVTVFYATNRQKTSSDLDHATYGSEQSGNIQLEYGVSSVTIPRDHRMGELEGPSIYKLEFRPDPDKHIVMDSAVSESKEEFHKQLMASVDSSVEKQLFIFIHGFNVQFEEAVRRTAQIKYDLGFAGTAVLYSWPSQGKMDPVSYHKDEEASRNSVLPLRRFIEDLAAQSGAKSIHIIAHSMGNRVAVAALAGMTRKASPVGHVAFMAPDVQAEDFIRMAKAMKGLVGDVTLYASSGDAALKASELVSGYARAGEGGAKVLVVPGVFETIDASTVDTSLLGLLHSYYADNSTILSDLFQLIRGQAAKDRFGLQVLASERGTYWNFRPSSR